jgi:hypothetical protein
LPPPEDHVDFIDMLESPTATATQCNLYASLLGPYPVENHGEAVACDSITDQKVPMFIYIQ